ncbi:MAG: hypothetical protein AAF762_08575, partial [Pseudomonadota bacterium]
MLKYVALTLVGLVAVGLTVGDEARRQDVSRASSDPLLDLSFANFADVATVEVAPLAPATSDEADAVAAAIAAAKVYRATKDVKVALRGTQRPEPARNENLPQTSLEAAANIWFVS